jgi:HSP20 family protein
MRKEQTMNTLTQNAPADSTPAGHDSELFVRPEVDIHDAPAAYMIHAEMPGVNRDRLEITIDDDRLTITGRKKASAEDAAHLLRERTVASYRRAFQLSPEIDRERIAAKVDQGLVTVTLPKVRRPEPRRIAVA